MELLTVIIIAIALGMDAFSLCIGIGLNGVTTKQKYLVSGAIGVFHVFMPLIGLIAGKTLGEFIGPLAGKIGAIILIAMGINILWKCYQKNEDDPDVIEGEKINISSTKNIMIMALSVSLDALTVGLGLGTFSVDIITAVVTFGIIAGLMTYTGLALGSKLSTVFGEKAEWIAGFILVLIGLKLFI